ncbi:hypothetical protein DQ384_26340 [Sphaerisporangium album]|uniref:Uncharacterized protein n=1 Tax=Sphaerisporangium album TaxID=509200 RepID=A0A367FCC7_9ACTN|nr:hypothetical protein [Sphaerisporangium album]RCG27240.1 hypothetical protein DQ384_26340 [Sphaerisporangium album]
MISASAEGQTREHLGHLMDQRRKQLRRQWEDIADHASISATHLRRFRRGQAGVSAIVEARLEEALLWAPGSIKLVLAGQEPILISGIGGVPQDAVGAKAAARTKEAAPDIAAMEAELAQRLAAMTPEEREQFERVIREEEVDYQRRRLRRNLIYAKLLRGEWTPEEPPEDT